MISARARRRPLARMGSTGDGGNDDRHAGTADNRTLLRKGWKQAADDLGDTKRVDIAAHPIGTLSLSLR